ncbi:MAG: aspartate kinase [Candidatus Paceibacteria bacterium]
MQKVIVNKFGGGILKIDLIPHIEKRLKEEVKAGFVPVCVVSALPGVTDELLDIANGKNFALQKKSILAKHRDTIDQLIKNKSIAETCWKDVTRLFAEVEHEATKIQHGHKSPKNEDKLVAYGERLSAVLFTHYLSSIGHPATLLKAEDIPLVTDDNFKNANIDYKTSAKNLTKKFEKISGMVVIPGFTGTTKEGHITTLGRGGTDTTACFIGAALNAEKIILWKDVGGVMSADPRIVKNAKTVPFVNYQEAEEAGKIIHDKAIQYVKIHNTPIEIASLVNPKQKTVIGKEVKSKKGTKIVSYKKNLVFFIVTDEEKKETDMLAVVNQACSKNNVDILLISNTRYNLQIVADNQNGKAEEVFAEIKKRIPQVTMSPVSMVFLVGNFAMQDVNEFNSLLIKLKTDMEISAFFYKNCTRLEAVIKEQNLDKIINTLHSKFIK